MGVLDGQAVSAAITNPAFINKNQADVMPNILGFTGSGASIADIQAAVNKLYTATGASESQTGTVYSAPAGTISNGDSHQTALTKLADKFDAATGHMHTGAAGDAPPISGGYITGVPYEQIVLSGGLLSAVTGSSWNVTSVLSAKTPSSSSTTLGVVVNAPYNRALLASGATSTLTDVLIDSIGDIIYGRVTESTGTWTLSFYSLVGSVETAYSFSSATDINWYYRELFRPLVSTPVYEPNYFEFESKSVKSLAASGTAGSVFGDVTFAAASGAVVQRVGQTITYGTNLYTTAAADVGSTGSAGVSTQASRGDHVHRGVHSLAATGQTALFGDVVLQAASGTLLSQTGQNILYSADYSATAASVGIANAPGTSIQLSHGDHVHQGIHSVAASGSASLFGDVIFQAASGTLLSQSGQNVLYSADEYTSAAADVGTTGSAGTSLQVSKGDHVHKGLRSIAASGNAAIFGDALLLAGTGISLSEVGQNITITASGGGVSSVAASGNAGITGAVVLVGGTNITLSEVGQNITINSSGGTSTGPLTTPHLSSGSQTVLTGNSMFWPYLEIITADTFTVQTTSELISVGTLAVSGTLTVSGTVVVLTD